MVATTTQNIPPWVIPAIQSCAFNPGMTNAAFREFVQHQFGGTAVEQTTEALNAGAGTTTGAQPRARRQGSNAGKSIVTRARRGSRRDALIELLSRSPGLSRGEILTKMGMKGDKSGEMSVSNALTALTKRNEIRRVDGKYVAATATVEQKKGLANNEVLTLVPETTGIAEADLRMALAGHGYGQDQINLALGRMTKSGRHLINQNGVLFRAKKEAAATAGLNDQRQQQAA